MTARVAIVTGAAQGIGYAIAIKLAHDGLNIAVNDIASKSEKIDAVVNEIKALGRDSIAVPADVSSETEVKEMIAQTVAALGSLDVVRSMLSCLLSSRVNVVCRWLQTLG